jgi:hypothetical protein
MSGRWSAWLLASRALLDFMGGVVSGGAVDRHVPAGTPLVMAPASGKIG